MSLLQRTITWNELEGWGASQLYEPALVKRWMRNRDALSVEDVLGARSAGLSRIFWTLMREEVLPAALIHQVALRLAKHLVERLEGDGAPADFRAHAALEAKERWLNGEVSAGEVAAACDLAARARDEQAAATEWAAARTGGEADPRAAAASAAAVHALDLDPRAAARGVLYALLDVYPEDQAADAVHALLDETLRAATSDAVTPDDGGQGGGQGGGGVHGYDGGHGHGDGPGSRGGVPVGTVLAYAGANPRALEQQGWLLCDGRALESSRNTELFEAIGHAFGSPRPGSFSVPRLQGVFLRGVSEASGRDPDAGSRVALQAGGNTGNAVGSLQFYATGRPRRSFTVSRSSIDGKRVDNGCGDRAAEYNPGAVTLTAATGGDLETRPPNKYVYFIIKAVDRVHGQPVAPPVGAVIPFAGVEQPAGMGDHWLLCNGAALSDADHRTLFHAIGTAHGVPGGGRFNLPDYRGFFLRGVNQGHGYDPDAAGRGRPAPGGNAGDQVGSSQGGATALPNQPFTTAFPNLPVRESGKGIAGLVFDVYRWVQGSASVALTQAGGGGDAESRPVNVSVDWYIRHA